MRLQKPVLTCALLLGSCAGAPVRPTAAVPQTAYLVGGRIDPTDVAPFAAWVKSQASQPQLDIVIDSPGGSVTAAVEMAAALLTRQGLTVCHVPKLAASAAVYLLQACDFRIAGADAQVTIHNARTEAGGVILPSRSALAASMIAMTLSRSDITMSEFQSRLGEDHDGAWTLDATTAASRGLLDIVISP